MVMPEPGTRDLVEQLARLGDAERRDLIRAAGVERQRRIKAAARDVGNTLLSGWSARKVARAIADAAHDRHGKLDPSLRLAIQRELQRQLGYLDDFPDADRIRQIVPE